MMNRDVHIIGIDVSTNRKKLGLARLIIQDSVALSIEVTDGRTVDSVEQLSEWIAAADAYLVAVDAPLGWPASMRSAIQSHAAGQPISEEPNNMFQRETDRFVYRELRKRPLDVGADRIARTAHAALKLIGSLREATGLELPMSWDADVPGVIEVYPAATMLVHGITEAGYKKSGDMGLPARIRLRDSLNQLPRSTPER